MKIKITILTLSALCFSFFSYCQTRVALTINVDRFDTTHYSTLSTFSNLPNINHNEIDKLQYKWELHKSDLSYYLPFQPDSFFIDPPPANSSLRTRADINYLLLLQKNRTEADEQKCLEINSLDMIVRNIGDTLWRNYEPLFYIGKTLGNWYCPSKFPATAILLARLCSDVNLYVISYKMMFKRIRPAEIDSSVKYFSVNEIKNYTSIPTNPVTPSYPSGHGASAYVIGYVMMEVVPEYKQVFFKDAVGFASSRELAGVHYPSDTDASRKFCRVYINKLFKSSPEFVRDFNRAKQEWKQFLSVKDSKH